jgi:hypothetical protein
MGLDMYAKRVPTELLGNAVVDFEIPEDERVQDLFYWRKHPNLHGWMENLYRQKGGVDADFNCVPVRLTDADLAALETAINSGELPQTSGFFFGASEDDAESRKQDMEFIQLARQALAEGDAVFYDSWW